MLPIEDQEAPNNPIQELPVGVKQKTFLQYPAVHFVLAAALSSLVLLSACATNPVSGNPELVMMSEDEEIKIGRAYHPKLVEQYGGEYESEELQNYISLIGERLAAGSHRKNLVYHFTLLDSPVINAFAVPGGYIYIARGLLAYLNSEDELAAVLGHELGHVTARHGVRQHAKQSIASILISVISSQSNVAYADEAFGLMSQLIITGYGRQYELEADELGADYMEAAGYSRPAMLDLLGVLKDHEEWEKKLAKEQDRQPNVYHGVFATHPSSDKRLQEAVGIDRSKTKPAQLRRREYLEMIDGLVFGPSEHEGVVRGASFHHRQLGISVDFPKRWVIKNFPTAVVAHNYGNTAVMRLTVVDQNRKQLPEEYLRDTFGENNLEQGTSLRTNLPGYAARTALRTPYGRRTAIVAALYHDKKIYRFLAATKEQDELDQYAVPFLNAIRSLRSINREDYEKAKPLRIKAIQAAEGDTIKRLAEDSPLPDHAEDVLRLINGLFPDGEPRAGQWLKVIE